VRPGVLALCGSRPTGDVTELMLLAPVAHDAAVVASDSEV
jgi:hypothetical protein